MSSSIFAASAALSISPGKFTSDAGSAAKALSSEFAEAMPHGERCLTMTVVGGSYWMAARQAA
jgi:hypothetical protein